MKNILLISILFSVAACAQNPQNWTSKQLMQPSELAEKINAGKDVPKIFCVGPGVEIPNSIDIGMTKEQTNIDKLKASLEKLPRNTYLVIYCGCCPFEHCPNVRPALALLQQMKFTNYYLLNLDHNIKQDWIDKGYPRSSK